MAKHAIHFCMCNGSKDSETRACGCQSLAPSDHDVFPTSSSEFVCRRAFALTARPEQATDSAGRRAGANAGYVWTCEALQYAFAGAASAGLLGSGKILDFVWISDAYCAATYDAATGILSLFGMNQDSGRPVLLVIARLDAVLGASKLAVR